MSCLILIGCGPRRAASKTTWTVSPARRSRTYPTRVVAPAGRSFGMPKLKQGLSQEKKDQEKNRAANDTADCGKSRSRELAKPGNKAPGDRGNCERASVTQGSE